jgi:squalene synthase HpnC
MLAQIELEIARNLPPSGSSLEDSRKYTRWLATHHYENFSIATFLLPRALRQDFYNVYAYCRWADDLGDEVPDSNAALELLDWWDDQLRECYAGRATHPVFIALQDTVARFDIPIEPFRDLLIAFRQDQTIRRYPTWRSVLDYCRNSANPVGRLVLYLWRYRDAERFALSDHTCTALQLANFWQDVSRDLDKDRVYIPLEVLAAAGLTEPELGARTFDARYVCVMRDLIGRTRELFKSGDPLVAMVDPSLRVDLRLFSGGGRAVLDAIESLGYNTLQRRPVITGVKKCQLLGRALGSHLFSRLVGNGK